MGRPRALSRALNRESHVRGEGEGNGRKAHDRAVGRTFPIGCAGESSPVTSKRVSAARTVLPMSKHSPVGERCPSRHQRTYRFIWSLGSNPRHATKLSARHNAIEVSSVHSPGSNPNGPRPTMSDTGLKVPGGLNSSVVPSASPAASPSIAPRNRSRTAVWLRSTRRVLVLAKAGSILAAVIPLRGGTHVGATLHRARERRRGDRPPIRQAS
jgi:hypothetical protein